MVIKKARHFIKEKIWQTPISGLPAKSAWTIKFFRILVITLRGFFNEDYLAQASSLTYYTLLSIAPFIAVTLAIARGFGFDETLSKELIEHFHDQEEVFSQLLNFAEAILTHSRTSWFTGIGVFLLLWTVLKILRLTETSFNDIWSIPQKRKIARQFSDYLALLLVAPIFFTLSSALGVFLAGNVALSASQSLKAEFLSTASNALLTLFPFVLTWVFFTFLYIFMPNTKVHFSSACIAGCIAALLYSLIQWGYFEFQIGVSEYSAVYGSFAAIPLFLIWINISWLVTLIGAKLSFALQNVAAYDFEQERLHLCPAFKKLLSLYIAHDCIQAFEKNLPPKAPIDLSNDLKIPLNLLQDLLIYLVEAKILAEVKSFNGNGGGYYPATSPEHLSVKAVLDALEHHGLQNIPIASSAQLEKLKECLASFDEILQHSGSNYLLKNL